MRAFLVMALCAGASAFQCAPSRAGVRRFAATPVEAVEEEDLSTLTESQANARKTTLEFRETKYFFGRVDVYLGRQFKPLSEVLQPTFKDDTTAVASVVVPVPFGMVIEESATNPGKIEVVDLVEDSNAAKAGVQVGDILRGTTAMALNIQQSSEEDFGFSVGFSEGTRQRAFLKVDNKNFDLVMAALQSNAATNSGPGEAALVFERRVRKPDAAPAE